MCRIVHGRVDAWLLLGTAVGLFGCPLLLDDRFSTVMLSEPDAGEGCIGGRCVSPPDGVGGRSGADTGGGSGSSGTAGSVSTAGTTSGSGGASGTAGAGGQGGAEAPCWTLELTPTTYDSSSNCIGVHGTSAVNVHTDSTLELSYDSGDPCFTGTIASTGWGAVYELTFAGDDNGDGVWNASSAGVTGFEFAYRGSGQPSSLRVYYKDPSGVDNCYVIGPGSTSVPFSIAHPGCTTSGETVDTARMDEVILAFPVRSDPYDADFCVQIRAFD